MNKTRKLYLNKRTSLSKGAHANFRREKKEWWLPSYGTITIMRTNDIEIKAGAGGPLYMRKRTLWPLLYLLLGKFNHSA